MRQIILDTETTGLHAAAGHRIIEIGCIELIKRRFTNNNFHYYINPDRNIDEGAIKIHGITNTFLINKPRFGEIYSKFIDYIKDAELIIHNAPFDVGFLNSEFELLSKDSQKIEQICQITDTLEMARKMHPGQRNSLDALCKRYSVDNTDRELHGALLDAKILANVYLAMTGGQSSLFEVGMQEIAASCHSTGTVNDSVIEDQCWKLPIQYASTEESTAHKAYLEDMQKSNPMILWS